MQRDALCVFYGAVTVLPPLPMQLPSCLPRPWEGGGVVVAELRM